MSMRGGCDNSLLPVALAVSRAGFNPVRGVAVLDSPLGGSARDEGRGPIFQGSEMNATVVVIGLGYVGLPLVVEFGKHCRTIGFDIACAKVESCRKGVDPSRELADEEMRAAVHAEYTADPKLLGEADIIIVAVPTPVDDAHIPDFGPLIGASRSIGRNMKKGAIVVYESTVYPGATEEVCIPVLERESGLKWKHDFFVGYSPERINPGDREHTLTKILKVVSGDTPETLDRVAALYESIVEPGVHRASSIKVAEAGQGHREHPARPQHRADERAGDHLRTGRHRHHRGARGGRHQVELPQVQARPGRRALHRRRSVLPDAQGRHDRLPPAGDPGRPAHQRRHGQVHRRADRQADDRRRQLRQGRARSTCSG